MKAGAFQISIFLILLFSAAHESCIAAGPKKSVPDSLHQLLSAEKNDSLRKEHIIKLAYYYLNSNPDSAVYYANKIAALGEKTHDQSVVARALTILGVECENRGDYKKALNYYLEGLKICEKASNEKGAADINNDIGLVFLDMGNYKLALEYYNKFLQYSIKINNKKNIGDAYNNIGIVYCSQGQLDTCLEYQLKAINLKKETGDKKGLATSLDNIGLIYLNKGKKEECLLYFSESLKLREELNDQLGMCITYLNISEAYIHQKEFKKAEEYAEKDLAMAKKLNSKVYQRHGYLALAQIHYKMNDFKKAYDYYHFYSVIKDSILNEANSKNMQEVQTRYESEKKDNEIRLLNKDNLVKESDLKKQQILNWSIGAGLIIMIISSVIVFRSYREKKKANVLLEEKNSAIYEQNLVISEKKKEIEDSINYARYIQKSILPDPELFKNYFKDSLLLFIPKDIVSGDFYFLHPSADEKTIWVAAVDCTGHGVPGGFMSVIGAEAFNQGVSEEPVSPANVLAAANKKIKLFLKQDEQHSNSKDGMDAALFSIDRDKTTLLFSGANRPLYLIRNNALSEYAPTKSSLGGITLNHQSFTEHAITLQKNDCIYIFSDGYADQFGGDRGKKLMTKNFKKMLMEIHARPMAEQQQILNDNIVKWRGSIEQVDDILVIGIRV